MVAYGFITLGKEQKLAVGNRQSAIAFLFPGQGSQYAGMGKDLAEKFPAARQIFEEVDAALGFALSEVCFNGPAEQLQLTENTQPAILAVSVAALRAMESEGLAAADYVAGQRPDLVLASSYRYYSDFQCDRSGHGRSRQ